MAVQIIRNNSGNRTATAGRLKYNITAPGINIVLPSGIFVSWVELNSNENASVVIGTANGANDFFDDTVIAGISYSVNKGFKVNETTLYITTNKDISITVYKL